MGSMDELINPGVVGKLQGALRAVAPTLELSALATAERTLAGERLRDRVNMQSSRPALIPP
jgi:hypothetical protein